MYAALEACWIDALLIGMVGLHFLGYGVPLVPLWVPFVPIAFSCWLARQYKRHANGFFSSSPFPAFALNSLVTLFLAWLTLLVAQRMDPGVLYDFPLFGPSVSQVAVSLVLVLLLCWRGVVLAQRNVDPCYVARTLGWGASVSVLVIFVEGINVTLGGVFYDAFPLLLLIVFFVCLSLMAHTLSHLIYTRHYHLVGLQGSAGRQERQAIRMVGALCFIFLLVTIFVGNIINPSLIDIVQQPLGMTLDWLVRGFGQVISFLLSPVGWLLNVLGKHIPVHSVPTSGGEGSAFSRGHGKLLHVPNQPVSHHDKLPSSSSNALAAFQSLITHYLLPLLLIALLVVILILVIRLLRQKKHSEEELHESLWSWSLFWQQLMAFLRALFAFLLPRHRSNVVASTNQVEQEGIVAPTARSIRAIYRALLSQAAKYGYPRQQDETPYEFEVRLCQHFPLAEEYLTIITDSYMRARYSGIALQESEVVYVRDAWKELEQKWQHF